MSLSSFLKSLMSAHYPVCVLIACLAWPNITLAASSKALSDDALKNIRFDQKLGAQISLDDEFRDETGHLVRLGDYFGKKPAILVLGYYECPMLCTFVLNGMIGSLQDIKWRIGEEFDVIDISINPSETPALAAAKKRTYVRRYGGKDASRGWHFLTGNESAIRHIADEVGFRYAYDNVAKQYAHPSGLVILTAQGKISHYLSGVIYSPKNLSDALMDASGHKIGSPIKQLFLLCFHYSPITGKYGPLIMIIVRVFGVTILLALSGYITIMFRRDKTSNMSKPRATGTN